MKKIMVLLAALIMSVALTAPSQAQGKAEPWTYCANTAATPLTGTYKHVEVPEFADCYMSGAVVTGNFFARNTPGNVVLVDTDFGHNVMVDGATGTVHVGASGCRFDPPVGNNLKVTNSHNVLICFVTADNNIMVTGNDGRVSLFNNVAGNNIKVNRNLAYAPNPGEGTREAASRIRLRNNVADNHIQLFNNHKSRRLVLVNNSPEPVVR